MKEIEKLKSGFQRFRERYYSREPELYKQLINRGQSPKVLVIACCDSRVHPVQVMDTDPGDIFAVRNVANVVPPYEQDGKPHGTSAAIEFAVNQLFVKHIIVLGHGQCGGIRSLMEGKHEDNRYDFIDPWMDIVAPARDRALKEHPDESFEEQCKACEQANIDIALNNLMGFPWIRERVEEKKLFVHGWYFDIQQGFLYVKEDSSDAYKPAS